MLSSWINKNRGTQLKDFIAAIKKGERDFLETLKLNESDFHDASFDELLSNTDDVLVGVNRVQKNFNKKIFNIFNNTLIKHHDNGDIKFIFYTTTNDGNKVYDFATTLFNEFGQGIFDDRRFTPFTNKQKINNLSQGTYFHQSDEIVHSWFYENISFLLQYKISPLQQFSFMVTIGAPKQYDFTIRRKGTILDLLSFDIHTLLNTEFLDLNEEIENDQIKFINYTYTLDEKEFNIFDTIMIRIFDSVRSFRKKVQTHVTFFSQIPIQSDAKIRVVEKLISVYGIDNIEIGRAHV